MVDDSENISIKVIDDSKQINIKVLTGYNYPRLGLGTFFIQDWLTKPGYGMEWLAQFDHIHTSSPPSYVKTVRDYAKAHGYSEWERRVRITYRICPNVVDRFCTGYVPPKWQKQMAALEADFSAMTFLATYYNKLLGCDWYFYGTKGIPIEIWGQFKACNANNIGETICYGVDKFQCDGTTWNRISECDASCNPPSGSAALNTTQDCPKGLWNGNIEIDGHIYNIGDTRGLTFLEWLKGPALNHMRNSMFYQMYDGFHCEDFPGAWVYVSQDYIYGNPDPDYVTKPGSGPHPNGLNYNQMEAYSRSYWDLNFFRGFIRGLTSDGKSVRFNGNGLRFMWSAYCAENHGNDHCTDPQCWLYNPNNPPIQDSAILHETMQGCKNEHFFGWGGWPGYCKPVMMKVYQIQDWWFRPLGTEYEGWNNTFNEVRASQATVAERAKWKRLGLSATLMGDAYCDIYAHKNDQFFLIFLRGENPPPEYAPEGIPELNIKLGYAVGPMQEYVAIETRPPIYYRKFYNPDDQKTRTVICNVYYAPYINYGTPPLTLPGYDGVWYEGDWNP